MSTDLETYQPAALAIRPGQEFWTDKQRAALSVLGIKNATNADLAVFMHYCQKTGLDPFSRQIYGIMRRVREDGQLVDKFTIQVGIDGFRVIRDRIAARLGVSVEYEDTIWYDADGGAHKVWLWDSPPAACVVTVVKDGRRFPGVVRFASYAARNKEGDLVSQWKTQPDHMIEKCAEAFALRRAFPHDLGGIYLEDELPPMPPQAGPGQRPARVTAAEIISNGKDSASEEPEPPQEQPQTERRRPGKRELAARQKLHNLLTQLPLGSDMDKWDVASFFAGAEVKDLNRLSAEQVTTVTAALEEALAAAKGDVKDAADRVWRVVQAGWEQGAQDAGDAAPGPEDGGQDG